jgi:Domain of unknown function (DUF4276)
MSVTRLYIFCEGQTEGTYANNTLHNHFLSGFGTSVIPLLIPHKRGITRREHKGGWLDYSKAKSFIHAIMAQHHGDETWFTTMLDLYAIPTDFPGLAGASGNPLERITALETHFEDDVCTDDLWRFTPHLQLHEFEALLLADTDQIKPTFPDRADGVDALAAELAGILPEEVNEGRQTAPSKRIIKHVAEYEGQKASAGPIIAARIGLTKLRQSCPHFDDWLSRLEVEIVHVVDHTSS